MSLNDRLGSPARLAEYLEFARDLAALGGRIAMRHFGKSPERARKADGTWVTEADWAVEAQIRLRIARTWSDHNVLGEEEGLTRAGGGAPLDGAPTWVIDPIDGTNNYMVGIPVWATLVALRAEQETLLGVCHAPALGETYEAARGQGTRFNGEPVHVDPAPELSAATVCSSGAESFYRWGLDNFYRALVEGCFRSRGFGDFWGHVLVARGAAHVMVEPETDLWDVAALQPIVEEAGGYISHIDGSAWSRKGTCLTTNGALHDTVVDLLTVS